MSDNEARAFRHLREAAAVVGRFSTERGFKLTGGGVIVWIRLPRDGAFWQEVVPWEVLLQSEINPITALLEGMLAQDNHIREFASNFTSGPRLAVDNTPGGGTRKTDGSGECE